MDLATQSIVLMFAGLVAFCLFVVLLFAASPRQAAVTEGAGGHRQSGNVALRAVALAFFILSIVITTAGLFMAQLG